MTLHFNFKLCEHTRIVKFTLLCFLWVLCLVIGILLASGMPQSNRDILNAAVSRNPSWVMILIVTGLPLLSYAVAMWYGWFAVDFALIALEGVCRGFCGFWIFLSYGSGAWLVRFFFLFSSAIGSVLLWWLIAKYSFSGVLSLKKDMYIAAIVLAFVTLFDRFLVSPFIIHLLMYF